MARIVGRLARLVREVMGWWWTRTGRECGLCGFFHPHPEAWHTFPYYRDHWAWRP